MKKILAWVLALSLLLCGAAFAEEAEEVHVKVGVVGENNEQWEQVIIPTLAEEGIIIELVKFSDYIIPNQALAQGEIDMNAFQHYDFMNNWNEENSAAYGVTLVGLCDTLIAPLCIYSDKITSLDELKEGDQIAIMNDVVNEARALRMLASTGLITLSEDSTELATVADIAENPLGLEFVEMEAALTPTAMKDPAIAIAFLNGTHAKDAGLTNDQALLVEEFDFDDESMHGIVNNIAVRADDIDNPVYQRIAEVYQSDEVRALFDTVYAGVYLPAWEAADEATEATDEATEAADEAADEAETEEPAAE
ncbi:MAG TPA: MetQ/NlpA family ABC transporter substrate-binding protein [Candidatus Ornithocaccomicrobium faecavium]|uniref:MetQ/NlpA family ABC transporter substrate-binding protein n=1 Tax=Candidatus Ornithocaccomicrobium faecavium TaxID=2840890 RepID=A0A9D1P655_9FIRM|nr:MetQ/NlpA family ABC transporter substrate-binding protein [Candidatus Ornithocaccomicrobium faecavium]